MTSQTEKVEAQKKLIGMGYSHAGNQHNGMLYARLTGKMLYKAFITKFGTINHYVPKKANKNERKLYR